MWPASWQEHLELLPGSCGRLAVWRRFGLMQDLSFCPCSASPRTEDAHSLSACHFGCDVSLMLGKGLRSQPSAGPFIGGMVMIKFWQFSHQISHLNLSAPSTVACWTLHGPNGFRIIEFGFFKNRYLFSHIICQRLDGGVLWKDHKIRNQKMKFKSSSSALIVSSWARHSPSLSLDVTQFPLIPQIGMMWTSKQCLRSTLKNHC